MHFGAFKFQNNGINTPRPTKKKKTRKPFVDYSNTPLRHQPLLFCPGEQSIIFTVWVSEMISIWISYNSFYCNCEWRNRCKEGLCILKHNLCICRKKPWKKNEGSTLSLKSGTLHPYLPTDNQFISLKWPLYTSVPKITIVPCIIFIMRSYRG